MQWRQALTSVTAVMSRVEQDWSDSVSHLCEYQMHRKMTAQIRAGPSSQEKSRACESVPPKDIVALARVPLMKPGHALIVSGLSAPALRWGSLIPFVKPSFCNCLS